MSVEREPASDVMIIGGGPAGCAAALTLRRYTSLTVTVAERGDYAQERVGESVSPGLLPLLDYLGVGKAFRAAEFQPAYAFTAAWGSGDVQDRDFLFSPQGHGWHLDRRQFDAGLAQAVDGHGACLLSDCQVVGVDRNDAEWRVHLDSSAGKSSVACRYLIDCTGRASRLARWVGARRTRLDHLVGLAGYVAVKGRAPASVTLIETVPEGWWYTAPVPGNRIISVLMTDADLVQRHGLHQHDGWWAALQKAPHTMHRLQGERPASVRAWPAQTQWLQPAAGAGWAAAGESAAAFDPLSAMGIGHAMSSGCQAARLAAAALAQPGANGHETYQRDISQHVANYLARKHAYYGMEQRFADHPFWQRRHHRDAADAESLAG